VYEINYGISTLIKIPIKNN